MTEQMNRLDGIAQRMHRAYESCNWVELRQAANELSDICQRISYGALKTMQATDLMTAAIEHYKEGEDGRR